MGCGCRKRAAATAQPGSNEAGERGTPRSKVAFFVTLEGVERRFSTLREARRAAEESGTGVEARRVVVES